MRIAAAMLLAAPAVLAFFTGGFRPEPRSWVAAMLWLLAALALARTRRPWLDAPGWWALGGIAGLAAWTYLSAAWAPVAAVAVEAAQLPALYAGATLAAALLLRERPVARAAEVALASGVVVVCGYALSERLLPGLVDLEASLRGEGRLEQPLTYWNALGALAATGVVLCARIAGDLARPVALRAGAAAAGAPVGLALWLTVSRGAIYACAAGLLVLFLTAPRREQLRAIAIVVGAGAVAAAAASPFEGVTAKLGDDRTAEGLVVLAATLVAATVSALLATRLAPGRRYTIPREATPAALCVFLAGLLLAASLGGEEPAGGSLDPGASRLASLTSNRYAYWDVAVSTFADAPLHGAGAGGWAVRWRQERERAEGVRDAHSLELQTAAELGLVGLALLAVWLGACAIAARRALSAVPDIAPGAIAGATVWLAHSALDWDFQMPAATLPAVVLGGLLLAQSASAMRGASRSNAHTASTHTAT